MKNHKLTVVVTGSSGFIGKHLCTALENYPDVAKLVRFDKVDKHEWNVCNDYDVANHIAGVEPDIVFHLAANTQVQYHRLYSETEALDNIYGMKTLLQNLYKPCRIVLASSVHADYNYSYYAASKASCELLLQAAMNMGLIDGAILRLTSVVGKDMTHGVVKAFMDKLRSDSPTLDIIGTEPGTYRPYVHVNDVVNAFIYFGIEAEQCSSFPQIISNDKAISIQQVADLVSGQMNIRKPYNWLGEESKWLGDVDKIYGNTYNGFSEWRPTYNTSTAIIKAVQENL